MSSRFAIHSTCIAACLVALLWAPLAAQQPLRAMLPDTAVAAVEVPDPRAAAAGLLSFLAPVPADLPEEVRTLVGFGLTAVQVMLGGSPDELLADLAQDGLVAGLVPGEPRPLLVLAARVRDEAAARRRAKKLLDGKARICVQDGHLLLANSDRGLDLLVERLGAKGGRWAEWPEAGCGGARAMVRAFVDLDALRAAAPHGQALAERLPGAARFLFGPLAAGVDVGHRLCAWLGAGEGHDVLLLHAEVDGGHKGSPFADLLARGGAARSLPAPPPGTGAVLSLDRSLHALLRAPGRFLPEASQAAIRGFLSIADQLDGRTSFVDDLVGGLDEPVHAYLRMPESPPASAELPLLLPELGFVARVRDGKVGPILERTMQVLLLIADAERAQRNQFPFVGREVREPGVRGLCAEPLPWRGPGAMPAEAAIAPTLLFAEGHAVLASTREMAMALVASLRAGAPETIAGDRLVLRLQHWRDWLERNRGPLEVARMFDEGETAAESRRFFGALGAVLAAFDRLEIRMAPGPERTAVEVELRRARP